jgi:hypothetical protein
MFEPGYTEKVVNYCSGVAYTYAGAAAAGSAASADARPAVASLQGPAVGDRAPDVDFEQGGRLFDRLRHPYFTLLAMPGRLDLAPILERVQARFGHCVAVEALPESAALIARYGQNDGRLFLVRPDGYVAGKAQAEDASVIEGWLARTLRPQSD